MDLRPLFFFCDANTAVYDTHLFKKRGGPDVVRLLRSLQARLVIPDISRGEYLTNYSKVSASAHEKAEEALSLLQSLSGQPVSAAFLQERFWVSRGPQILDDLREITLEIVATAELKAAALDRAVEGRKPALKPNQDIGLHPLS